MSMGHPSGQFNNVEESKYTMLDTAEDYDSIMAEADAREAALLAEEQNRAARAAQGTKAANPSTSAGGGPAARPTGI